MFHDAVSAAAERCQFRHGLLAVVLLVDRCYLHSAHIANRATHVELSPHAEAFEAVGVVHMQLRFVICKLASLAQ